MVLAAGGSWAESGSFSFDFVLSLPVLAAGGSVVESKLKNICR